MSPSKTLTIAAAAIAFGVFGSTIAPQTASAGYINNERLNVCAWYKSRAMSAGRRGQRGAAEHYWFLYRECMHYRID